MKTGADHHRAKLPTEKVDAMRKQRERFGTPFSQIGKMFDCSMWTARDICEYRTRVSG